MHLSRVNTEALISAENNAIFTKGLAGQFSETYNEA
jgi:hypothetical protein